MKHLISVIFLMHFVNATSQAGDLKGMEINLDGTWNVANTSKVDDWPVMVAMKADDQHEQNSPFQTEWYARSITAGS